MEQVILGSNQATVSGGVETASFYNPFQSFAEKKFSQANAVESASTEPTVPVGELGSKQLNPVAEVNQSETGNPLDKAINANGEMSDNSTQAPLTGNDQASFLVKEPADNQETPESAVDNNSLTTPDNQTDELSAAIPPRAESIAPGEAAAAVSETALPTDNVGENGHTPVALASPDTALENSNNVLEPVVEHDLVVPFPSDEQMGAALDLTPGSVDIQGAVFSQGVEQQATEKQQDQEIGGKQDVVGLLSHLTKGQDEQSAEKTSPQICEIDQKTGAWLGEGCQDEPISDEQSPPSVADLPTVGPNQERSKQFLTQQTVAVDAEQNPGESQQEMSTYTPTSGQIEIVDTNGDEASAYQSSSVEDNTISEREVDSVTASTQVDSHNGHESAVDEQPLSPPPSEQLAKENDLLSADKSQPSSEGVSTEIKALVDDDKQEAFERQLMNLTDGEQSTQQALERIKQYYTEQLQQENQEGRLLQLLFALEQVDKNLLNLKKQYQQIETLQRVWE